MSQTEAEEGKAPSWCLRPPIQVRPLSHFAQTFPFLTGHSECDAPLTLTNYTFDYLDKEWASEIDFVICASDHANFVWAWHARLTNDASACRDRRQRTVWPSFSRPYMPC